MADKLIIKFNFSGIVMEEELVEIHHKAGSIEEVRRVARYLVEERLVACAEIIPWVESVYLWNGALETGQESKLVLKTRRSLFDKVSQILKNHSSYEIPEILLLPILQASEPYKSWLLEETKARA